MDFVRSHFGKMQLWKVKHFFFTKMYLYMQYTLDSLLAPWQQAVWTKDVTTRATIRLGSAYISRCLISARKGSFCPPYRKRYITLHIGLIAPKNCHGYIPVNYWYTKPEISITILKYSIVFVLCRHICLILSYTYHA